MYSIKPRLIGLTCDQYFLHHLINNNIGNGKLFIIFLQLGIVQKTIMGRWLQ